MATKIRMSRGGSRNHPFYSIVVADGRSPRDGRYLEKIGTYNPALANDNPQRVILNVERAKYWIEKGAQPSERVAIFLYKAGVGEKPKLIASPKKSAPKAKAQERLKAQAEAAAKAAEAPAAETAAE